MAVVWLILKIILWILAGLLALVLLVLILPITAHLEYSAAQGFKAAVGILGLRFRVYPPKESKKKEKSQTKTASVQTDAVSPEPPSAAEPQPAHTSTVQVPQPEPQKPQPLREEIPIQEKTLPKETRQAPAPQPKPRKQPKTKKEPGTAQKLLSMLSMAKELIGIAGGAIRRLLKGIWIHQIRILLPIHKGDAAETAIQTGRIHAAAGASLGVLRNFLNLSFKQYQIEPDYTGERQDEAFFSCKITSSLIIMIIVAVWALPKILKTVNNSDFKILPGR